jgi:hypothetical protein
LLVVNQFLSHLRGTGDTMCLCYRSLIHEHLSRNYFPGHAGRLQSGYQAEAP